MKKFLPWILTIVIVGGAGLWVYKAVTKPLPGEVVTEVGGGKLSQEHMTDIAEALYSSNPPAGGPHFPLWAKPGVYDRFISDGYFIHSLEHGYIIISYDCDELKAENTKLKLLKEAFAHGDEEVKDSTQSAKPLMHMTAKVASGAGWITAQNQPEIEVELPESFKTEACRGLVNELSAFTKVAQRVIVVPRMNMDTPVALTAWGRILKLGNIDKEAIENFISAFHNRGPEATME